MVIIALFVVYLLLRSKTSSKDVKSKAQKQEEIYKQYQRILKDELRGLENQQLKDKRLELLKRFSDELNRNLFFTKEESRKLIQKLIDENI